MYDNVGMSLRPYIESICGNSGVAFHGCALKAIDGNVGMSLSPYKESSSALTWHVIMI